MSSLNNPSLLFKSSKKIRKQNAFTKELFKESLDDSIEKTTNETRQKSNNDALPTIPWELMTKELHCFNNLEDYPKELRTIIANKEYKDPKILENIIKIVYSLKVPQNAEGFEKKIGKLRNLSERQQRSVEQFLKNKYFFTNDAMYYQEYLCFLQLCDILKREFEEFFNSMHPRKEKIELKKTPECESKDYMEFAKLLNAFYNPKGGNFDQLLFPNSCDMQFMENSFANDLFGYKNNFNWLNWQYQNLGNENLKKEGVHDYEYKTKE
jgi:hypothetical protein